MGCLSLTKRSSSVPEDDAVLFSDLCYGRARAGDTMRTMIRGSARHAVTVLLAVAFAVALSTAPAGGNAEVQQEHVGTYAQADIEFGLGLYRSTCATCHGEDGGGVTGINLRIATPRAQTDEALMMLIATGIPDTAMPPGEYSQSELTALVAYIRSMGELDARDVQIGDAGRGESIVGGKGNCTSCHRIGRTGTLGSAPELSDIGNLRTAGRLEASLLDPTDAMIPINRPVRAVLADGTAVSGRRLNEDTYSVQLVDDDGQLQSLDKTTLREFTVITESPMPSYTDMLSEQEIADVIAYLLTLRGPEGLN